MSRPAGQVPLAFANLSNGSFDGYVAMRGRVDPSTRPAGRGREPLDERGATVFGDTLRAVAVGLVVRGSGGDR